MLSNLLISDITLQVHMRATDACFHVTEQSYSHRVCCASVRPKWCNDAFTWETACWSFQSHKKITEFDCGSTVYFRIVFVKFSLWTSCCACRYDSEGRLTNMTYPTGMVTSLHREIEKSINIDIESSNRDDDITVITNLSSVEASYTVVQGVCVLIMFLWSKMSQVTCFNLLFFMQCMWA